MMNRYKTNIRVLMTVTLPLFISLWFIPLFGKHEDEAAITLFRYLDSWEAWVFIGCHVAMFLLPSLAIGWLSQALWAIIRQQHETKAEHRRPR